ncbi:MAG: uracil-DNA glycosylase [Alphaproteobacteria bacterium]|nr:uracil-DNA glycosylase [Alphaproteobacteria bacterium]
MQDNLLSAPDPDCSLCSRLFKFRLEQRKLHPDWHNAPVPSFGAHDATLLVVGLAPGLRGANRTGRPFTGDHAGLLLYETLFKYGFAKGSYKASRKDKLTLINTRITNAVRCVPPLNKPTSNEMSSCRAFLRNEIKANFNLRAIVALGRIAHDNTLSALSISRPRFPFQHGAIHSLSSELTLFDSYHTSRYNMNTGRLTIDMFERIFSNIRAFLKPETPSPDRQPRAL